jgi:hypothetical protein
MKLRMSLPLILVALLLIPSLAMAASASGPDPAASRLFADLAPEAPSCNGAVSPALTPEPQFQSDPLFCGTCSNAACAGKFVGASCSMLFPAHCVRGLSCSPGEISCRCEAL